MTEFPEPDYTPTRRGFTVVWLLPLLAILIALGVAWQSYRDRGPLIYVTFPSAAGIEVDKTPLRYRDVQVGLVEVVEFARDLQSVEVAIRVDKDMAQYIDADASFWLVQPQVSARGITGLDTVLSGVYIEGNWDGDAPSPQSNFTALPVQPLARAGETGTRVILRSGDGRQLAAGAPVLFNGIEVGRLGTPELSDDGTQVTIEAFIASPHDRRLTTATRFWDSSGFSLELGPGGVSLDVDSLAALVEGGISFGTLVSGGDAITAGQEYTVFPSQSAARASVFDDASGVAFAAGILLDSDVQGLAVGAPVRFQGIKVGDVTDITGFVTPGAPSRDVRPLARLSLSPARLGITEAESADDVLAALQARTARGFRARLSSEGLLGQTVIVELLDLPQLGAAPIDTTTTDLPILPTSAPDLADASASVDGLVERVNNLPIEEVLSSAIGLMDSITRLAADPNTQAIPDEALGLLSDTRGLVGSDEIATPLADVQAAATDLRSVVAEIESSNGLQSLMRALEQSEDIADNLAEASADLPALTERVSQVFADIGALPLGDLTQQTTDVVNRLDAILSDESVAQIAPSLASTLASADATLTELQQSGSVAQLNATLASAQSLTDDLTRYAEPIPGIFEDITQVVDDIAALPLADLATSANDVVARVDTLLSAEGIEDIPTALSAALLELQASLQELRDGGAVQSLNETLASANSALKSVDEAAQSLPALTTRLQGVANDMDALINTYGDRSRFNSELRDAIRAATETANAFRSLARTIERNPSALITGR